MKPYNAIPPEVVSEVYRQFQVMPNAPQLDPSHLLVVAGLLEANRVTALEFAAAARWILETSKLYPAPAVLIQRVKDERMRFAREERGTEWAHREPVKMIPSPENTGLADRFKRECDWPEESGRSPAWFRYGMWKLGIFPKQYAIHGTQPNTRRGGGPRPLIPGARD